jgi:hypothetical protein
VLEKRLLLATFTVVNPGDDLNFDPSNPPPPDQYTLRDAVDLSDMTPGSNVIDFDLPGASPTIDLLGTLMITNPVVIDGTTQPGFKGQPIVVIDGVDAGTEVDAIDIHSNNTTVRGVVIDDFIGTGLAIYGNSDSVQDNFLGVDPTGTATAGFQLGNDIDILGAHNTIGGTTASQRNIIAGQPPTVGSPAIGIAGSGATNNTIEGNFIGTDVTGESVIGNEDSAIYLTNGAADNTIGGTVPGSGNLISGNGQSGPFDAVQIDGDGTDGNVIAGNFIGTDASGKKALGNGGNGVGIIGGAAENTIGGPSLAARNVISGNQGAGIAINGSGTSANLVLGNLIGTDSSGKTALPNLAVGISISDGASGNIVGGTNSAAANVISGNAGDGIDIDGSGSSANSVLGNFIGVDITQENRLANAGDGLSIFGGATENTIGGAGIQFGNLISGNSGNGIQITGAGTSNNVVVGNQIGTNHAGSRAIPNGTPGSTSPNTGCGVLIDSGANDNTIGGSLGATVSGNVISGNIADGVLLTGIDTMFNVVEGNYIGTDSSWVDTYVATGAVYGAPGLSGLGNAGDGVHITESSSNNMIGGTDGATNPAAMDGNIIAFNAMNGVAVDSGTGNTIREDLFLDNGGSAFWPGPAPTPPFLPIALGGNATQLNPNSATAQAGANNLENYPIVTVSYNTPNQIQIVNQSDSDATVEVYALAQVVAPNGDLVSAGAQLLAVETVAASGAVQFAQPNISKYLQIVPSGDSSSLNIVGTATDPEGNTSEFGVALTPAEVRSAYGINDLTYDGAGQTIAIVSQGNDPNLLADLDTFDQQFGITNNGPSLYEQYGQAADFVTVFNQGGAPNATSIFEEAIDVEWAHAIAPGAHIDVVEGTSALASVPMAAALPGVSVVSISFGDTEIGAPQPTGQIEKTVSASQEQTYDQMFSIPGVVLLAASGDHGLFDKSYPAFSPYVVAVGGTTLTLSADGTYGSEAGWGNGAASAAAGGGSGGGQSLFEQEPAYQLGVQATGYRTIPDVSIIGGTKVAIADSYNQYAGNPGWAAAYGTSVSTPLWAGLIALVDQGRTEAGRAAFNNDNPEQIQEALYSLPATDFHSPAELGGNNDTGSAGLLDPERYDEVTGLGSPIVNLLVPDLINYNPGTSNSNPVVTVSTNALNLGTTTQGTAGSAQTFTVSGSGLTAGIVLNAPTGVELSNDGGASYSVTLDLPQTGGTVSSRPSTYVSAPRRQLVR